MIEAIATAAIWIAFCALLAIGGIAIEIHQRHRRKRQHDILPEPDTIAWRNARSLAEYRRRRTELDHTGAPT
jgi:hypothetical protein